MLREDIQTFKMFLSKKKNHFTFRRYLSFMFHSARAAYIQRQCDVNSMGTFL